MPEGYDTHADYLEWVEADAAARQEAVRAALLQAFEPFIERREVEVINFSAMTALDLAAAIQAQPGILKALLACCNIAGRAIERDLDIRGIDTYNPRLTEAKAAAIAGYLKSFLPQEIAVPALSELDRYFFVDKEIRARKGRWERAVLESLNALSRLTFRKRRFEVGGESFELDAAAPETGPIEVGVDVKRIEARRDIHKRSDEIINKAAKFKAVFSRGKFAAVVYYPFTAEHVNVQNRLTSPYIDAVCFASQSHEQAAVAVGLLVDRLGIRRD
ncbi:MAG: hypothetical protein L6Q92_04675 [Phycisphaerae bacterium]|nr:hypothetical protein [Phycisphaerae bacterium]